MRGDRNMTMLTMTPKKARAAIIKCLEVGLVPFVTSSPGMGKSSLARSIAEEGGLKIIDLRLSQCAPEDLMGLPMKVETPAGLKASFVPFDTFPTDGDEIPEGMNGWLLLLDEMNSAPRSVQAAAYKIVLDRMVGQAKLHDAVHIMAAGNLATDKAIVNSLSTAMQSRVIHIEMVSSHKDWMDWAVAQRVDSRLLAFLEFRPNLLQAFDADHNDRTFPCQRTWEFAHKLIEGEPIDKIDRTLIAGAVGEGAAIEFHSFLQVYAELPTFQQILKDPKNTALPSQPGPQYAILMMLVEKTTLNNLQDVLIYANRMPPEFLVILCRNLGTREPKFLKNPDYIRLSRQLVRYINDDDDEFGVRAA